MDGVILHLFDEFAPDFMSICCWVFKDKIQWNYQDVFFDKNALKKQHLQNWVCYVQGPMSHMIAHLIRLCWRAGPFCYHRLSKIRTWISNYIHGLMWDAITHPCPNFKEVRAWMNNYISPLYKDVIIYPWPNADAGLAYLCKMGPRWCWITAC